MTDPEYTGVYVDNVEVASADITVSSATHSASLRSLRHSSRLAVIVAAVLATVLRRVLGQSPVSVIPIALTHLVFTAKVPEGAGSYYCMGQPGISRLSLQNSIAHPIPSNFESQNT